jgi:hypothetical protein
METTWAVMSELVRTFRDSLPHGFSRDVFKALIGTFIGAGLAFWFALRKDDLTKQKERKAAGNMAVLTLLEMTDEYLRTKAVIEGFKEGLLRLQPKSPMWMFVKPMHLTLNEELRFNLDSLVFLLEHKDGARAIELLLSAERKYRDFFGLLKSHAPISEELQRKLSDANIDPREGARISDMEKVIGFQIVAKTVTLVEGVFAHFEEKESVFEQACTQLPRLLQKLFGKKGVIRITLPTPQELRERAKKNLPEFA